ncbi:MAG: EF-hand domain-containing protein [Akkermansiaceae bacterium]|nr:EF-hand domain-containing protein [Akkermansiaceae bacterium]MDP4898632.1 EF-hand domain-containing protein [Akkermansiaceae bacterium]
MKCITLLALCVLAGCATSPGPIKRQMIGLIEKFDRWDINGDGFLTESELKEAEKLSNFTAAEIVEFYDTGGDGKVSLKEAQEGIARLPEAREIAAKKEA